MMMPVHHALAQVIRCEALDQYVFALPRGEEHCSWRRQTSMRIPLSKFHSHVTQSPFVMNSHCLS